MMRRWIFAGLVLAVSIAAATVMYHAPRALEETAVAARPLDAMMPEGALLYIEAKDFSGLLKAWNSSREKAEWLESDNHSVFSQSRLFLRLQKFFQRFGAVTGMPADTEFVTAAAGNESALALYDIGKIQFVYITHLKSRDFLNSALWQSRNKFQTRVAGGITFFLRSDDEGKQMMAFAVAGDYLVLSTREDLMVRALQLVDRQPERSLSQEAWYSAAVAGAPKTRGELHMVLDMKKIAMEPHFRTYWVQQNITEMQSYSAAVSDLYCEGKTYREERMLVRKSGAERERAGGDRPSQAVAELLSMVPEHYGFYQARAADSDEILEVLQKIVLPHQPEDVTSERNAPQVVLTSGEVSSESDLETRIDISANRGMELSAGPSALKKQLDVADPMAFLEVQSTQQNTDGGLLNMPRLLVVNAATPWDADGVEQAIRSELATGLSVSKLGLQWRQVNDQRYLELDGLHPLYIAVRDRFLFASNERVWLIKALQSGRGPRKDEGVTYVAGFDHAGERENFYELTRVLDMATESKTWNGNYAPKFFSRNVGSLSRALERLESETVVEREEKDKVLQTVTYRWVR